ncbi:MAG: type 1 glutamine amidotransferase domain-containing protein [Bifidobacteriaceae bacterium]|jgi:putative intracellular protease/amidase|nr:type 1 glutamine amidotransferase domain-containing protein [Bifidobacteriaceae bacterium]
MAKKVAIILTAADALPLKDGSTHSTGFWAEEFIVAHRGLLAAGFDVSVATPDGRPAPVDPGSVSVEAVGEDAARDYRQYLASISSQLQHPLSLSAIDATDYSAIVMPGGHGPMVDLAFDETMGHVLEHADAEGIVIAPFCHGPAGLLSAKKADGSFLFAGRTMTAFTDREETMGGVQGITWYLASKLNERGAHVTAGEPFTSHIEIDGNLISGQNPQSSAAVTNAVIAALR